MEGIKRIQCQNLTPSYHMEEKRARNVAEELGALLECKVLKSNNASSDELCHVIKTKCHN
jgi:hypothetical protein